MSENTKIEWAKHTFNPWRGCTKVSEGCRHCYAETMSKRNPKVLGVWGPQGSRAIAAESYWKQPIAWNKSAAKAGEMHRVFCASLADVAEGPESMPASEWPKVEEARKRLIELVWVTPHLDWLFLTKRPENMLDMLVRAGMYAVANPTLPCPQKNLWLGTSVENQTAADARIPHLLKCPAAVRFLSVEPLLGPVDIADWLAPNAVLGPKHGKPAVDWIIVGGESGPGARICNVEWVRSILNQCQAAGVACFIKQLGENIRAEEPEGVAKIKLSKKGGLMEEWPTDLRVRELPEGRG